MKYLKKHIRLSDVIGSDASTPYVGTVVGSKRVIYASKKQYGDTVHFVQDLENEYYKPENPELNTLFTLDQSVLDGNNILS